MRAKRKQAWEVNIGDLVLTPYQPRTWQRVTEVEITKDKEMPVRIDTERYRTWFGMHESVPCR
jgi:hypothetical protein